jgi:hypothetical protein
VRIARPILLVSAFIWMTVRTIRRERQEMDGEVPASRRTDE